MDYFESIAKSLLERDGYWVRQSFKVNLSPAQKRNIAPEKFSIPRPEIDLLALSVDRAEVVAFEVKSFFDSGGTAYSDFTTMFEVPQGRYKLFTCVRYRDIVLDQLHADLVAKQLIHDNVKIRLGLIVGNAKKADVPSIQKHFDDNGWVFWSPEDVKAKVECFAAEGYENDPAVITAKILKR